jgi:hypothetical protein
MQLLSLVYDRIVELTFQVFICGSLQASCENAGKLQGAAPASTAARLNAAKLQARGKKNLASRHPAPSSKVAV